MDAAFPGSKFILSVRGSADEWYSSLVNFHMMRLQKRTGEKRIPTLEDVKNDPYRYPGYLYRVRQLTVGGADEKDAYPEERLKVYYERNNKIIIDYFSTSI